MMPTIEDAAIFWEMMCKIIYSKWLNQKPSKELTRKNGCRRIEQDNTKFLMVQEERNIFGKEWNSQLTESLIIKKW